MKRLWMGLAICGLMTGLAFGAEPERKVITLCGHRMELRTGEEIKALGLTWVDVPDAENASTYYIQGANALHQLAAEDNAWYDELQHALRHGWDKSLKTLAERLGQTQAALDFYRKGAAMDKCQLPLNKSDFLMGMLLPDLSKAREAARLLAGNARRHEAHGRFKEAMDDYLAILRIGEHYGNGRTLIAHLVGTACIQIGTDASVSGLCRYEYPPQQIKRLITALAERRDRLPRFEHAMQTERAFGLGTIDEIMNLGLGGVDVMWRGGVSGEMPKPSRLAVRVNRLLWPDQTIKKDVAAFYDRSIEAAKKSFYKEGARPDLMKGIKSWNFFAQLLLPALGHTRQVMVRGEARYEMLGLVAALKLYRQQVGVWPDELGWLIQDKIIAKLPTDPFSGKPYRYKLDEGHFVLYSVGPDMKDDGGKIDGNNAPDVGFSSRFDLPKPYGKE
jgi:tetratricopeptide (TPR) repeat protein